MIEVKNLTFAYPGSSKPVLKGISFVFPSQGLFYLTGESGSGKTTFLNVLSGLFNSYEGEISINGQNLKELSESERGEMYRCEMAYSTQEDLVGSYETVEEALTLPLEIYSLSKAEKKVRIIQAAKRLSLKELLRSKCSALSGGELRRVSLARALVRDFSILLLDEPLGPLDEKKRKQVNAIIREKSKSSLVIVVTHNTDELDPQGHVLRMADGALNDGFYQTPMRIIDVKKTGGRKPFTAIKTLKYVIRMFLSNILHVSFSSFASSLALISIGLTCLISKGISSSLLSYFADAANPNTLLIEEAENRMTDSDFSSAPFYRAQSLCGKYSSLLGYGAYYEGDFENFFVNANQFYFLNGDQRLLLPSLDFRSLAETTYYKELGQEGAGFGSLDFSEEEIGLGLSQKDAESLSGLFGLMEKDVFLGLNDYLLHNSIVVNGKIENSSIRYRLSFLFKVRKIIFTGHSQFIHTNPLFAEWLFDDFMCFQNVSRREEADLGRAKVFKGYYLMVNIARKREFLDAFAGEEDYKGFFLSPLRNELLSYYHPEDEKTGDRLLLLNGYSSTLSFADVQKIQKEFSKEVSNIYYSDSFYYFSSQGLGGGFLKPVYASGDRGLLNQIADFNYEAQFDLHGFQGSTISFGPGVVMGDLSGVQKKPLQFKPYLNKPPLLKGSYPSGFNQALISSSLAKLLFQNNECLDQKLYLTCLAETVYKQGGYKNIFSDGSVIITGLIDSEENLILQEPRFLNALEQDQLNISLSDSLLDHALMEFKDGSDMNSILKILKEEFPEYHFSLPLLKVAESIDQIVSYIEKGLLAFALFSSLIASVLMGLVIFFFIKEGEKRIGMMSLMGFTKREISGFYMTSGFLICLAAYFSSSAFLLVFSWAFGKSLEVKMGISFMFAAPEIFLLNLLCAMALFVISAFLSSFEIRKADLLRVYKKSDN